MRRRRGQTYIASHLVDERQQWQQAMPRGRKERALGYGGGPLPSDDILVTHRHVHRMLTKEDQRRNRMSQRRRVARGVTVVHAPQPPPARRISPRTSEQRRPMPDADATDPAAVRLPKWRYVDSLHAAQPGMWVHALSRHNFTELLL